MKRILEVLIIYTLISFAACMGVSFFYGHIPELLDKAVGGYKFLRGLSYFLDVLPALIISGFCMGCAIQWRRTDTVEQKRFSQAMGKRFKIVLFTSIAVTAILTFSEELIYPVVKDGLAWREEQPVLLKKYMKLAQDSLKDGEPLLAWQYADQAYQIYGQDEEVAAFYKLVTDQKDITLANMTSGMNVSQLSVIQNPIQERNDSLSLKEMMKRAHKAEEEENWFDTHYWASLAASTCSGTDTISSEAFDLANKAWNLLNNPKLNREDEENKFFSKKKEGYAALVRGDDLEAYYIFTELNASLAERKKDPDITKYLALAKERISGKYFFIDETENLEKIENKRNVYFTLTHADKSFDVVYIRGIATLKQSGGVVKYLNGLAVVSYDADGVFVRAMKVPYAKMLEMPSDIFPEQLLKENGVSSDVQSVPFIILQSIDRNTRGIVCKPEYTYEPSGLLDSVAIKFVDSDLYLEKIMKEYLALHLSPESHTDEKVITEVQKVMENETTMFFPMSYTDFNTLSDASIGAARMSILSLMKFISKTTSYGYSREVYIQSLVRRCVYPLYIMILIVLAAGFAWNYRMEEKDIFRFWWIFIFPFFSFFFFMFLTLTDYVFSFLNYLIVGIAGTFALPLAFIFYVILLTGLAFYFISRRSD